MTEEKGLEVAVTTQRQIYCAFCLTGSEEKLARTIAEDGMTAIPAYVHRIVVKNGKQSREKRNLLPGYLLFETDDELDGRQRVALYDNPYFVKLLRYENGVYTLHGRDLEFVQWIKAHNGVIDVSKVYRLGDRIKVVQGPLKDYEGSIVQVNKKRKCVAIQLGNSSVMSKIWISIEFLEGDAHSGAE